MESPELTTLTTVDHDDIFLPLIESNLPKNFEEELEDFDGPPKRNEEKEEIIHDDQVGALIMQSNIVATKEEDWLHDNTFHNKCRTQEKICNAIIDNETCVAFRASLRVEDCRKGTSLGHVRKSRAIFFPCRVVIFP